MDNLDVSSALSAIRNDISAIVPVLSYYEQQIANVKEEIRLKSKRLDGAIIDQSSLLYRYDELRVEMKKVSEVVGVVVAEKYGSLWKFYTEKYSRELSPKDKDQYIKHESKYIRLLEIQAEVDELYQKFEAVVHAFQSRGYALNNLTRLYANNVTDIML